MNRRRFLQYSALGGLACALPGAFARDWQGLTLGVATYKGAAPTFFEQAGIERPPYGVKYAEFNGGNLGFEALVSGTLDLAPMSEIPPIFGIRNQAPVRLIAVLTGDVNNQAFIVPRGATMQSLAELPGKRVGYIRSTSSHYLLLRALKDQGLTLADIQPLALTPQDGFAAFQNGNLDVWVTFGYFIQLAELRSGARVLRTGQGYLSGNYVIAANRRAIEDPLKRAAIEDYVRREYRSWQWVQHHPEAWAARCEQVLGIPREVFIAQYKAQSGPRVLQAVDDAAVRSQQDVADTFHAAGVLPQRLDVAPLWDRSFSWTE
ncbi:sulfonate transport system substrate-binding protein [Pseudomonas sp. TE6288]|uniref:ABC transporter substrate-binding protein n=1 Tax=Pseudomonas hunanensis TaxID=1247546 RepID=UPI0024068C18|nr:ABC transporter substrate-binding protein [Pseudomonas hunanensis]MDF9756947.1 sulfonate transport system substrate-binding protein [Pseudomonas hunanensis]